MFQLKISLCLGYILLEVASILRKSNCKLSAYFSKVDVKLMGNLFRFSIRLVLYFQFVSWIIFCFSLQKGIDCFPNLSAISRVIFNFIMIIICLFLSYFIVDIISSGFVCTPITYVTRAHSLFLKIITVYNWPLELRCEPGWRFITNSFGAQWTMFVSNTCKELFPSIPH